MTALNTISKLKNRAGVWFFFISVLSGFFAFADQKDEILNPGLPWVGYNDIGFTIAVDSGIDRQLHLEAGTRTEDFSQVWIGSIFIPTDQPVTFTAEAHNGLRLFLDGLSVIEGWSEDAPREAVFQAKTPGRVPLRLEFFQRGSRGFLRLYWEWKDHPRELIPASAFFHTNRERGAIEAMREGKSTPFENGAGIYLPEEGMCGQAAQSDLPLSAQPGPHLFLDDFEISESHGLERVVLRPDRNPSIPNPVVTAGEDHCVLPYVSVSYLPDTHRFRIWYNAFVDTRTFERTHLAAMESEDGIHFLRPYRVCETPDIQIGSEVIDRGIEFGDKSSRYLYGYWFGGGLRILKSADGFTWQPLVNQTILAHERDINHIDWDEKRKFYESTFAKDRFGNTWSGCRRVIMMSVSKDLLHWEPQWFVLTPDDKRDEGDTQFYGLEGDIVRGGLHIGMVKVLRDDLKAEGTSEESYGMGYTTLAWSRDNRNWMRDRTPFFEPDADVHSWDHAIAWIDEQVQVGREIFMYYGGYRQGHKTERFKERQIGLVKMPLDRYVARRAHGDNPGFLKTVPIKLDKPAGMLCLNINALAGHARVQVCDAVTGEVFPDFSFHDCFPIREDNLCVPVRWQAVNFEKVAGQTVQLEFELRNADLFAFEFTEQKKSENSGQDR